MASGQQIAEENLQRFKTWMASKTDDDYRQMVSRGVLSRTEIAAECGFAKSALTQNPRIRDALKSLELQLRGREVLPPLAPLAQDEETPAVVKKVDSARTMLNAERLSRLEQENASLKAENAELKRLLSRYAVLQEVLSETGRLPR